jgi:hypothetical protein
LVGRLEERESLTPGSTPFRFAALLHNGPGGGGPFMSEETAKRITNVKAEEAEQ